MTENEAQKWLERFEWDDSEETSEALATICEALQEYPKFRAIGTVKEIKIREAQFARLSEGYLNDLTLLREYQAIGTINEVRILKDYKELYDVYNLIGTIEEFKALKEKSEPKKLEIEKFWGYDDLMCPNCKSYKIRNPKYCCDCGQALDWE